MQICWCLLKFCQIDKISTGTCIFPDLLTIYLRTRILQNAMSYFCALSENDAKPENLWNVYVTNNDKDFAQTVMPGPVAQSVGHLTCKSEVLGSIPSQATYFVSPSTDSRGTVVSYRRKYVHEVLVNCLGGLSLPRKCG